VLNEKAWTQIEEWRVDFGCCHSDFFKLTPLSVGLGCSYEIQVGGIHIYIYTLA